MSEIDIKQVINRLDELAINVRVLNLEHGFLDVDSSDQLRSLMLRAAGKLHVIQKQIEEQK
jgi:hypothetical protein